MNKMAEFQSLFKNPPASFRGKPFWSWSGELDREELLRQIPIFKEMGMGGFFMHARSGLKTEYLGEKWFGLINDCADAAEREGLEGWIYDEDRWPSGSAGGMATEREEFRMKSIRLSVYDIQDSPSFPSKNIIAAFVAELDGLRLQKYRQIDLSEKINLTRSEKILIFHWETMAGHTFYNGNTYLDTLSRPATEEFLRITHEKYAEKCGSRFGTTIKGVFTDEPHRGMLMCRNNESADGEESEWTVPFTDQLFHEFESEWGYDLRARLPELFYLPMESNISEVKWHFCEVIQEMFLKNWAEPIHQWCQKHHLQLTGHILHEDSLVGQAVPCGSAMRYYEYLDIPGVDILGNQNKAYWVIKQVQSAARQFGKKWILSELYGCTGWQFTFQDHKRIGHWQAVLGVNQRCHHMAWSTMAGEAKRDYPASIFFQSAWYQEYKELEDYFSRLHVVLQQGEPVCDLLVLNPIESIGAQCHPGWAQWLEAKSPLLQEKQKRYEELFHWIMALGTDFDYGDEEHIARFAEISIENKIPIFKLGKGRYRIVVVSELETIRRTTLDKLREFHQAGGKVVFVGLPPTHVNALLSPLANVFAQEAIQCDHSELALAGILKPLSSAPIYWSTSSKNLLFQLRKDGDNYFLVLVNLSENDSCEVCFYSAVGSGVHELDCLQNQIHSVALKMENKVPTWEVKIDPLGAKVYLITNQLHPHALISSPTDYSTPQTIALQKEYQLSEPNLCVLDRASFAIENEGWSERKDILEIDEIVRKRLDLPLRSGSMLQPWALAQSGILAQSKSARLSLRYSFEITTKNALPSQLMIENPDSFQVSLNQKPQHAPVSKAWRIDTCFKTIDLNPDDFLLGENEIILTTSFHAEIDLESIYLLGNFGVKIDEAQVSIVPQPSRIEVGNLVDQGFPFYSGSIRYTGVLDRPLKKGENIRVSVSNFGGALVKIELPGGAAGQISSPPYQTKLKAKGGETEVLFEVFLTRVNTFGPLHLHPKECEAIGPSTFRKEKNHDLSYQLWPSGLLSIPEIEYSERASWFIHNKT